MNKIILLFTLCSLVLAGCKGVKPPEMAPRQVVIYLSAKALSDIELKSTASQDEDKISKIILFGVDDKLKVVETFQAIPNPSLAGEPLTITKQEVKSLYVIANPSASLEGANPSTVSELMNLTGDFSTAPAPPFLMGGKGDIIGDKANIELVRAVAKIVFTGKDGFEIEKVTVQKTPNKGFVFTQTTFSVPTSSGKAEYKDIASATFYVAESTGKDPVEFKVTGTFEGKSATYTITLSNNKQPIDIVRNTHYLMNIKPITEDICDVTINILEWNGVIVVDEVVIPDDAFNK